MDQVSRRGLARGAAWTVPVVAVAAAAPVRAASQLRCGVLDWDSFAAGVVPTAPLATTVPGVTATPVVSYSSGTAPGSNSGKVMAGPTGGVSGNYYRIGIDNVKPNDIVTVTFTFSQPVTDLNFTMTDIDTHHVEGQNKGWQNMVYVSPAPTTSSPAGNILGAGTATSPWHANAPYDAADTDGSDNVSVVYAGPITTVSITLTNGGSAWGHGNAAIGITDLSFCTTP
ncbi:MAG: hypothetical protein V9G19_10085 [Tetrasphaera sp.]